jgi:hypothetical protein
MASKFLLSSLESAFTISLFVSKAKPTKYCCCLIAPKEAKISFVGANSISNVVSFFFIFSVATFFGL